MKIEGDYVFDAPRQRVWDALQDPTVLAAILPGCDKLEKIGDESYEGALKIKVGPVQGKFKGNIKLENIVAPESYDMLVDGKGAPGFVKATGNLLLSGDNGKTNMVYSGEAQVGGRIANVGQRLLDSSAKAIINQSLTALNAYLTAQTAVVPPAAPPLPAAESAQRSPAPPPATAYTPPPPPQQISQTAFALAVAKDVYEDLVPAEWRPIVTSVVTTLLTMLVARILFGRKK
jgi:carbon monoxide dehydrogenase subunit G